MSNESNNSANKFLALMGMDDMEQLKASTQVIAGAVSAFYKQLLDDGVPCEHAVHLTNTWLANNFSQRPSE